MTITVTIEKNKNTKSTEESDGGRRGIQNTRVKLRTEGNRWGN